MSKLVESVLRLFHTDTVHGRKRPTVSKRDAVRHRSRRTRKQRSVLAADSFIFVPPEEDRGKPYIMRGRANTCGDELLSSNASQRNSKLMFRKRRSGGSRVSDEGSSRASLSSGRAVSFQEPLNLEIELDDRSPSVPVLPTTKNVVYEIRCDPGTNNSGRLFRPKSCQLDYYATPYEPNTRTPSPVAPPSPGRRIRRADSDLAYFLGDNRGTSVSRPSNVLHVLCSSCKYNMCVEGVRIF